MPESLPERPEEIRQDPISVVELECLCELLDQSDLGSRPALVAMVALHRVAGALARSNAREILNLGYSPSRTARELAVGTQTALLQVTAPERHDLLEVLSRTDPTLVIAAELDQRIRHLDEADTPR